MPDMTGHQLALLLSTYGYWVVFAFVAVESMGVPVPGESVLIGAAVYAGTTHRLEIAMIILAASVGAVAGDNLGYLAGHSGGYRLLHRYGRCVRLDESKLRLGQYLFDRHGGKMVFFGRFLPVLRIWAAFFAGAHRMQWRKFLVFNAGGGMLWAVVMGMLTYTFGTAAAHAGGIMGAVGAGCGVVVMAGTAYGLRRNEQKWQMAADSLQVRRCQIAA